MAVGAPQKVLLLSGMRIICRDVIHVGAVTAYLSGNCAGAPTNKLRDFPITQSIHVIFSYTTALFYGKMMVVHTGLPSVVWCVVTSFYQRSV